MGLNLTSKKAVVAEISEVAGKAYALVATEYHGLTVAHMTQLHARARETGVYLRVVKNTLARGRLTGRNLRVRKIVWLVRWFWLSQWKTRAQLHVCGATSSRKTTSLTKKWSSF